MIKSFKDKESERIFKRYYSKTFPEDIQRAALRKLRMLNRAEDLNDLRVPPGNRIEVLKGKRKGQQRRKQGLAEDLDTFWFLFSFQLTLY